MNAENTEQPIDLLAAVVLHVLVSEGRDGLGVEQIARTVERNADEHDEVRRALAVLVADDLATEEGEHWKPTRAAIRAQELSF